MHKLLTCIKTGKCSIKQINTEHALKFSGFIHSKNGILNMIVKYADYIDN